MVKNRVIRISPEGDVSSLYSDFLSEVGEMNVERASNVEFSNEIGKWVVTFLMGALKNSCLLRTFDKREDALDAEVSELNSQLINGALI